MYVLYFLLRVGVYNAHFVTCILCLFLTFCIQIRLRKIKAFTVSVFKLWFLVRCSDL